MTLELTVVWRCECGCQFTNETITQFNGCITSYCREAKSLLVQSFTFPDILQLEEPASRPSESTMAAHSFQWRCSPSACAEKVLDFCIVKSMQLVVSLLHYAFATEIIFSQSERSWRSSLIDFSPLQYLEWLLGRKKNLPTILPVCGPILIM